ncbi:MAG: family 43 glycosylhydrolase [Solobacterium sp.]|nr:family 43 glycosylhydrolase [Solobacterium sp.]
MMKKILNPLFGFDEYTPDGEPHVFGSRLYLYSSQDVYHGERYSPGDYVAWSCPVDDLSDWRCEGVIYRRGQDPLDPGGSRCLYAPDVIDGPDGKYYLYYELEGIDGISAAVSDSPAGPFSYYGQVTYPAGVKREELPFYPFGFDPGLYREGNHVYLALGFSVDFPIAGMDLKPQNMKGAFITELEPDMLTMKTVPQYVIPGYGQGEGTSFAGHEFLEASSLRKYAGKYYFIYSSQHQHELCWAVSDSIFGPYEYQGVLISNAMEDGHLRSNWANNHGSVLQIADRFYVFYHRHTCGTQYSRQACAEPIRFENGRFVTAVMSMEGISGNDLDPGRYAAGHACFVRDGADGTFIPFGAVPMDTARIDRDRVINIRESTVVFRHIRKLKEIELKLSGTAGGTVELFINGAYAGTEALQDSVRFAAAAEHAEVELRFRSPVPVSLLTVSFTD